MKGGLNGDQLAAALGISPARVSQLKKAGKIQPDARGKYDLRKVRATLKQSVVQRQPQSKATESLDEQPEDVPVVPEAADGTDAAITSPPGTLTHEQTRLTREKAKTAELERRKLEGSLLPRDEVKQAWDEMRSAARNTFLAIPDELGDTLASEYNPIRCREMIRERIYQALNELAEYPTAA